MPFDAGLIGAAAQGVGSLIGLIAGGKQKREGRKLLKGLQYPDQQIPSEITNAAATGLPSEQYNMAMKNIQQQQLMALRGAHDRRSGIGLIPQIQGATNNATLNLDAKNSEVRQQNQFRLAGWKDKVWQNNVKEKYDRDRDYAMNLIGYGNQNTMGGLDQLAGGAAMAVNSLFGGGNRRSSTSNLRPTQQGSLLDNGLPMGNYDGQSGISQGYF